MYIRGRSRLTVNINHEVWKMFDSLYVNIDNIIALDIPDLDKWMNKR